MKYWYTFWGQYRLARKIGSSRGEALRCGFNIIMLTLGIYKPEAM